MYIVVSSAAHNDLIDGLLEEHNQDGSHHDLTSTNATITNLNVTNLQVGSQTPSADWTGTAVPNSVTYNGNRSYDLVFNGSDLTGSINPGTRLRTTRTVAAPTQSTSLNGTNQYWVKTSPNKLTFTDDFLVSAWIKLTSYASAFIVSRYNGTSGWAMYVNANGTISMNGYNSGSGNTSAVNSYQSIPLNKWVHITVQLDMSAFTATATTSYIMIDGVDVPATVVRSGTNPTALVQAGNLEIGSANGGTAPFPGKIAQVAIFNTKVTQATIRGYISQGLTGTETNLASAYSFNGVTADLNTTTPNDLTAQNSATSTNSDSPYGGQANGIVSPTLDYAIVESATFSTNTTLTVRTSELGTIPSNGGVAALSYSSARSPYGMPSNKLQWKVPLYRSPVLASLALTPTGTGGAEVNGSKFIFRAPFDGTIDAYSYVGIRANNSGVTDISVQFQNNGSSIAPVLPHTISRPARAITNGGPQASTGSLRLKMPIIKDAVYELRMWGSSNQNGDSVADGTGFVEYIITQNNAVEDYL